MSLVNRSTHTPQWFLLMTALATGTVVMALEIVGSRLLAPVFGNSLFVWGALIGVILAAMSSGYAFGGWVSDRYPGSKVLAGLLLFSGAWTFLIAWLGQPVLFKVAAAIEDPRWGPCVAAALLLGPPAFGLSGVLPAMLRLAVSDFEYFGRHTGRMIALSTMGSLAGTWGTAFFFLSWIGSQALVAWLGAIQAVLGLWWLIRETTVRPLVIGMLVLCIGGLGVGAWFPIQILPAPVYQEDSPYQQVRIRDDDLFRYLILDRTYHAVMWKADPISLFLPYSQLMVASLALVAEPKRGLILGHGGGSLAKWLAHQWPELELDVVEFDPVVVRMAEEYFSYQRPPQHHVHVRDARVFLNSTDQTYDLMWIDAFARHMIPFHLTTVEFFAALRAHLAPNGILAVNLASSGEGGDLLRANAVMQTMRQSFPNVESFAVKGPWKSSPSRSENLVFFAGSQLNQDMFSTIVTKVNRLVEQQRLPFEAIALLGTHRAKPWEAGVVLTDNYAPYDLLTGSTVQEVQPETGVRTK
ncbi:MAG TPA: fused MFS/spermidine synthase [Nitrospiraceae bacterium]|nr:fused MFS/spermidine synthase [Nitrospiraceae bacterium]